MFWIPSWADARQMRVLSGFLRFSVFVHSRDASALGCSGYRPGLTPDKSAICLVFCAFRYSFSRELRPLSGVRDTVLGVRPTDVLFVWSFAVFGIRSVESCGHSRVFRLPSLADARQKRNLSVFLWFSVFVQSRDASALGCSGYRPWLTPDKSAICRVFCGFRYPFRRQSRGDFSCSALLIVPLTNMMNLLQLTFHFKAKKTEYHPVSGKIYS
ncbi:hypothetical protein C8U37_1029 [Trichococcus patagoniensis]|uniref:Uncharacterized protein n=1 Tax=Trichococcus patagoniensis TaxID=382641 RepID=A0A2T5IQ11_9LACT|nr:hypothetical protein C8U37_1029 [Trichococcus patagoniensis]